MMQFATPPDRTDEEIFPKDKDGKTLITWASLDQTGKDMINMALAQRNKERVLAGESKYEDVDAMIDQVVCAPPAITFHSECYHYEVGC